NNVDVVVIEDGVLFKGTIHTEKGRSKPLTIQGKGMIICRFTSKPGNSTKMQYNALELNDGSAHKIYGITMVNGRHFAARVSADAHVQNVKFYGYRANNDGIVAGADSKIENCFFKCNDDHIKLYNPRMIVRNCVFYEQQNGAIFQFAWNKLTPGDNCLIENIEVLEWEAGCGDPDLGQGGVARSFINHRESEENGKVCANTTFRNVYIQPQIARFVCLNGLDHPITYNNLTLENFTLEKAPKDYNWIYANKADDNSTSIEINFKNVRFGDGFIAQSDFKTKGTVELNFDNTGDKYTGYMNPGEGNSCACDPSSSRNILEEAALTIYPNPAKDAINIELENLKQGALLSLYDPSGRLLLSENIVSNVQSFNITSLQSGMYILHIQNGFKIHTESIIIQ
ncbi:MAG: T9SS type A sorting domain-containing protein, partial [Bacteroidales bacterium]|nr:T9SS type A sorting domain-containing protein [Bacteroidales bacterium]